MTSTADSPCRSLTVASRTAASARRSLRARPMFLFVRTLARVEAEMDMIGAPSEGHPCPGWWSLRLPLAVEVNLAADLEPPVRGFLDPGVTCDLDPSRLRGDPLRVLRHERLG